MSSDKLELSQPLNCLKCHRQTKSNKRVIYIIAPSIMKEWRLLLDGRRITLTFLLLLKLLTNHVCDHFSFQHWIRMIKIYQQRIEGRITVKRYTFGRIRTCINSLNISRSVCRNFENACLQICFIINILFLLTFIWKAQCIFIWAQSSVSE